MVSKNTHAQFTRGLSVVRFRDSRLGSNISLSCTEMSKRKKAKTAIVQGLMDVTKTAESLLSDSDSSQSKYRGAASTLQEGEGVSC